METIIKNSSISPFKFILFFFYIVVFHEKLFQNSVFSLSTYKNDLLFFVPEKFAATHPGPCWRFGLLHASFPVYSFSNLYWSDHSRLQFTFKLKQADNLYFDKTDYWYSKVQQITIFVCWLICGTHLKISLSPS